MKEYTTAVEFQMQFISNIELIDKVCAIDELRQYANAVIYMEEDIADGNELDYSDEDLQESYEEFGKQFNICIEIAKKHNLL